MERSKSSRHTRQPTIRRPRQLLANDRRHHEQEAAVRQFREWDRAMQHRHGPLYYRALGWTRH